MDMFDRLEDTVNRYEDITAELGNPDVVNDQNRFRKLMKEQSSLAPLIAAYTEYKNCKQTIEDSLQLLDEESDEELKELAKEELNEAKKRVEELENEIKILLLPKDPNDDKDISGTFCGRAVPYVYPLCRIKGLEGRSCQRG